MSRQAAARGTSRPHVAGYSSNGHGLPRANFSAIQRSRLLAAAVRGIDELGYSRTTVARITVRAGVSRKTFYELFDSREDCLIAALDDVVERIEGELAGLALDACAWRERVRIGTWTILSCFERQPALAKACAVIAQRGEGAVVERREQILARLTAIVDEGREARAGGSSCAPLTAEGLVCAAIAIVQARLLEDRPEPLTSLHGELMSMIVLPYLGSAAARREQTRPAPAPAKPPPARQASGASGASGDPLGGLPMRMTYRTARVLDSIAERPGSSNRDVGERAGIVDQGQISKLLSRLERLGLVHNTGQGQSMGAANIWQLTQHGEQIVRHTRTQSP